MPKSKYLECSSCHAQLPAAEPASLCACGGPLLVRYSLGDIRRHWLRRDVSRGPATMWRYAPVLPPLSEHTVSLGEGWTPLIRARRWGARIGAESLWVKDDGLNPTGSFKARGHACAISMCAELGIRKVAISSSGNSAAALAAYAAAAGIEAHIFMPRTAPLANYLACMACGAQVTLVDDLAATPEAGWFDLGAFQEPYRTEGNKTIGYEIAEQLDWEIPDAIVCPTGGGSALVGMWKAFQEMELLGWMGGKRPKMIAVQAAGCSPIVRAFEEGEPRSRFFEDARTIAAGLRVPKSAADFLVLEAVRLSGGTCIAVSDDEMLDAGIQLASEEGIFASPEGAASVAAAGKLLASGFLKPTDCTVLFNTASGLKYSEAYSTRFPRPVSGEQDKLGGLITPR
jgi:threonine synthase